MRSSAINNQSGIILIPVLVTLTLLGLVGVTFVFYASARTCAQNPTIEIRDTRCVKDIGPPDNR
jgi:flagellar basal body-associated protein FliL